MLGKRISRITAHRRPIASGMGIVGNEACQGRIGTVKKTLTRLTFNAVHHRHRFPMRRSIRGGSMALAVGWIIH
ncbi:MAG: hypothetical protein QNJ97_05665 [Myxococcota bacterium]|nr:hypothetical protein [Myxococcota bacterium]